MKFGETGKTSATPAPQQSVESVTCETVIDSADLAALESTSLPLLQALETGSIEAKELLKQNAAQLQRCVPAHYRELVRKIDEFNFEEAAAILRKVISAQHDQQDVRTASATSDTKSAD